MPPRGEAGEERRRHPSILQPTSLFFGVLFGVLGTVIGLELLTRVGITPNSSIIAVVAAIAHLPDTARASARRFRDLAEQNLAQTLISGSTDRNFDESA